jgi:hypothetical protein
MRGVLPEERPILEDGIGSCTGNPDDMRALIDSGKTYPWDKNESRIGERLIAQGRLKIVVCTCGYRHPITTAAGREALTLSDLATKPLDSILT